MGVCLIGLLPVKARNLGVDDSTRLIESTGKSSIVDMNRHNELYRTHRYYRHDPQAQPRLPNLEAVTTSHQRLTATGKRYETCEDVTSAAASFVALVDGRSSYR